MWKETMAPLTAMAPQMPMPMSENIPSFDTMVKANFSFAERLLENQRKFAMSVSEVMEMKPEEEASKAAPSKASTKP